MSKEENGFFLVKEEILPEAIKVLKLKGTAASGT